MRTLLDKFAAERASVLLVLLPPAAASIDDFIAHGFISAVRATNAPVDILLAEVTAAQVMDKTAVAELKKEIAAHTKNYRHIWLAGISLGAFNALHYAAAFADDIAGLILLAPYPGTGDILREIRDAGGVNAWASAHENSCEDERIWWHWLSKNSEARNHSTHNAKRIYIGLGIDDRFIDGQRLLASTLPANDVDEIAGDHSWPVWCELWQRWLARGVFASAAVNAKTGVTAS